MDEVVRQQLTTAWIQAAAAVVQAIGAVAAIIFSVKIARDAEHRAAAAEQASAERERQAEANAVAREEAARQAADMRDHKASVAPFNNALDVVLTTTDLVLEELDTRIAEMQGHAGQRSHYVVSINSERVTGLRNQLTNIAATSPDPDFVRAIEALKLALGGPEVRVSDLPEAVVVWLQGRRGDLEQARHELSTFRLA